eukprot:6635664-Pyramimonas_sp.AAC.1
MDARKLRLVLPPWAAADIGRDHGNPSLSTPRPSINRSRQNSHPPPDPPEPPPSRDQPPPFGGA